MLLLKYRTKEGISESGLLTILFCVADGKGAGITFTENFVL